MTYTSAQARTRIDNFRRKEYWEKEDELWALQMYGDVSFSNNNIFYESAMRTRWGEGLPEWLADEPDGLLQVFKEKFLECGQDAWIDRTSISRVDEDETIEARLWICRSYGTPPVAPPDTEGVWIYLCSVSLSPEARCPWVDCYEHDASCELCEGDNYVYFGDGYVMQVWTQILRH